MNTKEENIMDTYDIEKIYRELRYKFEAGHLTKDQIDNITERFNKAYDSYIEFRRISYMTPIYTRELKILCINFSDLRRRALERA